MFQNQSGLRKHGSWFLGDSHSLILKVQAHAYSQNPKRYLLIILYSNEKKSEDYSNRLKILSSLEYLAFSGPLGANKIIKKKKNLYSE